MSAVNTEPSRHLEVPNGRCNFKDLSHGQWAPICGCRRFWEDPVDGIGTRARAFICFCGHHACFHDHATVHPMIPTSAYAQATYQEEAPREQAPDVGLPDQASREADNGYLTTSIRVTPQTGAGLGIQHLDRPAGVWDAINAYARHRTAANSETGSTLPSTISASLCEAEGVASSRAYMRHVLTQSRRFGPTLRIPPSTMQDQEMESATEANTPSLRESPNLNRESPVRRVEALTAGMQTEPGRPTVHLQQTSADATPQTLDGAKVVRQHPTRPGHPQPAHSISNHSAQIVDVGTNPGSNSYIELKNLVHGCLQRVEILENLSSSYVPVEEIEDKFELFDARLLDLESWRGDAEQHQQTARPNAELQSSPDSADFQIPVDEDNARSAPASPSASEVSATAAVYAEYDGRFEALEERLEFLEDRIPSFVNPWQVEVVLLPWGIDLGGIWSGCDSFAKPQDVSDEWEGLDAPVAGFLGDTTAKSRAWTTDSITAWADAAQEWLCPKACGPNGIVFQRLRSRGLVRDISITGPGAKSIMHLCTKAFAHFLDRNCQGDELDQATRQNYQALSEPLVPLRKVKRSDRLRLLSPSEMKSSALWNALFLDGDVFMKAKAGQRRLYLTTPQAYIQSHDPGWTWYAIKELPNVQLLSRNGMAGSDDHPEAEEDCWIYRREYDGLVRAESSTSGHHSQGSPWSVESQASLGSSAHYEVLPISPHSEARPSDVQQSRTSSLPTSLRQNSVSSSNGKRRVASFEGASAHKRRRTSVISEADRRGPMCTPRLSREPPSPFNYENQEETSNAPGTRRREETPFAYATPHSHGNNTIVTNAGGGDGDTEADTDIIQTARNEQRAADLSNEMLSSSPLSTNRLDGVFNHMTFVHTGKS